MHDLGYEPADVVERRYQFVSLQEPLNTDAIREYHGGLVEFLKWRLKRGELPLALSRRSVSTLNTPRGCRMAAVRYEAGSERVRIRYCLNANDRSESVLLLATSLTKLYVSTKMTPEEARECALVHARREERFIADDFREVTQSQTQRLEQLPSMLGPDLWFDCKKIISKELHNRYALKPNLADRAWSPQLRPRAIAHDKLEAPQVQLSLNIPGGF